MDLSQFILGFARPFTSDLLGMPMDAATNATNLGIAGIGYLGGKTGLLRPDQLPNIIDPATVPGTSDYIANHLGVGDTGNPDYAKGRLAGNTAGLLTGLAAAGVIGPSAARGAPAAADQLGHILLPKFFAQQYNVPTAGAEIALPSGSVFQQYAGRTNPSPVKGFATQFNVGDVFPDLAQLPAGPRLPGKTIGDLSVEKYSGPANSRGYYDGSTGTIGYNGAAFMNADELLSTIKHEVTHAGQNGANTMEKGANHALFQNPQAVSDMMQASQPIVQRQASSQPELLQQFLNVQRDPFKMYQNSLGEVLARTSQLGTNQVVDPAVLARFFKQELPAGGLDDTWSMGQIFPPGTQTSVGQTPIPTKLMSGFGWNANRGLIYDSRGQIIGRY